MTRNLITSLILFSATITTAFAAATTGTPNDLFNCLKNKGYNLETVSNSNYVGDSAAFNRRLTFKPVAIVFPQSAQNVSDIVKCASTNSFKVSARSGGHSYAAFGLGGQDNNLVVDLRNLKSVTLQSDGVTVVSGTGNRLGDLAQQIYNLNKRALPHGTCPYVGSGGHAGMGGFGLWSRTSGLLLDRIVAAQVVLANGTIVTASATSNTDLFWAVRGAAPSFGIVTAWTFATLPAPPTSIGFTVSWSPSSGAKLTQSQFVSAFSAFQNYSLTASSNLGLDGDIGTDGSGIILSFLGFWYGDASQFNSIIAPFMSALPAGFKLSQKSYGWIESLQFLSGDGSISTAQPDGNDNFFAKSLMTKGPSSTAQLTSFASYLYTKGISSDTDWFIGFDLYGANSAISKVAKDATSYENRDAFITYQFYASKESSQSSYPSDGISFVSGMLTSLESNPVAAYPNYADPTLTSAQWKAQYYNTHYARLLGIKNSVDPSNLFDFPQAIGRA